MRKFVVETLNNEIVVDDIDGVIQTLSSIQNDPKDEVMFVRYGSVKCPELYLDEMLFAINGYTRTHGKELMDELNDALNV